MRKVPHIRQNNPTNSHIRSDCLFNIEPGQVRMIICPSQLINSNGYSYHLDLGDKVIVTGLVATGAQPSSIGPLWAIIYHDSTFNVSASWIYRATKYL